MKTNLLCQALLASLCLAPATASAKDYYLAPGGTGNGLSIERPFGDPVKAFAALKAGDVLWVRGGTYKLSQTIKVNQTGTADQRICVYAYPGDERPVFDFSGQPRSNATEASAYRGILHNIGANYWHYRGLDICNSADNGMKLEGSYCVVELCRFYGNQDTGLQQGFGKDSKGNNTRNTEFKYGRYNIIVNCDAYDNYDPWTSGGNADGFAIKLYPGPGNEFHGCRAWHNSDDGWDLYYTAFPIVVDNCWCLKNGFDKGNANGFKMGGCKQGGTSMGAHVFKNCIAAWHAKKGFDQNHHREGSYLINDLSFANGVNYGYNMEAPEAGNWVLRNCVGFSGDRNHQFTTLPDTKACTWTDLDNVNPLSDRNGGSGYNKTIADYSTEYEDLSYETAIGPRQANGELPLKFGRLKAGSRFIDKGTPITGFKTVDSHKDYYAYSDNAPQDWSITLDIPYNGDAPDYGPYEYQGDDNTYDIAKHMPQNDGTLPEETPEVGDGKNWQVTTLVNAYLFQDEAIADSVAKYITATSDGVKVNPTYYGKNSTGYPAAAGDKYTATWGALRIPNGGFAEFTLPSLAEFKTTLYCTGGRTLKVDWHYADNSASGTKSTDFKTGTAAADIASMAGKIEKKPVVVRLTNTKGGDMYLTDLTLGIYEEIDEDGNVITGIRNAAAPERLHTLYQTQNGLIVYGDIASLRVVSLDGKTVAQSERSQFVNTAALAPGTYLVVIKDNAGHTATRKFVRK